jgi:hypothetical protein
MEAPRDRELGVVDGTAAVLVVEEEGLSEPAAQRMASATFDLPDPFGPTITPTPCSRRTSTASGKDLNPRSFMARRCTGAQATLRPG